MSQLPVDGFVVVAVVAAQGIQASTAGGTLSAGPTVWVTSLTFIAAVITLRGLPSPSQMSCCLLQKQLLPLALTP
ncbi:hypothetical protein [Kitasatospora sp. HPMI-4]|uniref:hypothetical protein n=1 Tax=Kitasatospora sp. HPMI-4 TaxID=3448443 RepID=UPI003F19B77E